MKHILITIAAVVLVGCASTKSLNISTVSIGMDKQEVVSLQEPFRVAAMDGSEYFIYRGFDKELFKPNGFMVYEAFIRFKDGKVDAYGRLDDFDSTRHKELLIKKAEGNESNNTLRLSPIYPKNSVKKTINNTDQLLSAAMPPEELNKMIIGK